MLLQCETEPASPAVDWLRADMLASLRELNEEALELCAAAPAGGCAALGEIARHWPRLDAAARMRAAGCLYLLLDAGFADDEHLGCGAACRVHEAAPGCAPCFAPEAAAPVSQAVLTFAWHLARTEAAAARLLLAVPAAGVAALAQLTLGEVRALARRCTARLRPRWAQRPAVWREFLAAAAAEDAARLARARLRGQRLMAAELRQGPATSMSVFDRRTSA